jgi:putative ABC transport system substrate-binding protein
MNTYQKVLTLLLILSLTLTLAACGGSGDGDQAEEMLEIGIIQIAPHPSLDNCYQGFIEGLASEGFKEGENIKIDYQNAQGEMANSDMIAKNMVSAQYDLILGIATPAAMSAYSAAKDTDIPIVFSAVSDPLAAGIVKSLEKPEYSTGTSDVLPLEAQLQMIRAFMPEAKKIGVLYTTSEPNSVTHLAALEELAPEYGFEVVAVGVTNASEVGSGAASLVSKGVDCINNFTDNNVVNNLSTLVHAADGANIPVFGSEIEQVKNGCAASQSIDYVSLGRETGKIAAKILRGEAKAGDIPVSLISDCTPVYNKEVCDRLGLVLPEEYKDAENVGQ